MASPSSQKADKRPISFVLQNDGTGETVQVTPPIRPEDLSRAETALMTPVQTFGGAYIEDFGPGLTNIQISGHTGWRGGQSEDGVASFLKLRDTIWSKWFADRVAAVEAGRHPDTVKLIFSDALDDIVSVVFPSSFVLKRSKSRPLLMMYQVSMTVLTDRLDQQLADELRLTGSGNQALGVASLAGSISRLQRASQSVRSWVNGSLVAPVQSFLRTSTAVFQQVVDQANTVRGTIEGVSNQLVGVASDLAQVGRNAFNTYNAVAGLPDFAMHQVSAVTAAYENVFCIMNNVFSLRPQYPDYTGLYGASACSSTIGGTPLSLYQGQNPFETIIPNEAPPPAVSSVARSNIDIMVRADPVLAPMPLSELSARLDDINRGVSL